MKRALRTAAALAHEERIPRWLRILLIFGILPIPGPVDNVALVVGIVLLVTFHRTVMAEHWTVQGLAPLQPIDTWGGWC